MKNFRSINTAIIVTIAILVMVNFFAARLFFRLDFTADKRYTLSQATKNILRSLEEPVTVVAYFTKDVPPDILSIRNDFKDMLVEYANVSKGKVLYEFVDPNKNQESEQRALQAGIQPVLLSSREKDEAVQKKVFLGVKISKGERSDIIPLIQPGAAMEYSLSSSIKKLTVKNKSLIGLIQGHGEPSAGVYPQAMEPISILYRVEHVNLDDPGLNLSKYKALAMIGTKDSVPATHFNRIDQYLENGGRLYLAFDRVHNENAYGFPVGTSIDEWLHKRGVSVEPSFIIDINCGSIGVPQQQGGMNYVANVRFPYLPVISNFESHPITKGLEQVLLQFASPITFKNTPGIKYSVIAKSSDKAGILPAPLTFDVYKQWQQSDFPIAKGIAVAATIEGTSKSGKPYKMVIITDGFFAVNGEGQSAQEVQPDNVNLMVNSFDWLSDDTGLLDLRTKEVTSRPLDAKSDAVKMLIKWLNFLLPVILILVYGFYRMQKKRNIKIRRMQDGVL